MKRSSGKKSALKPGPGRPAPGRPVKAQTKQSATARFDPDVLDQLDAMEKASGINRSGLLQIATRAMLKIGLAATMKVLE